MRILAAVTALAFVAVRLVPAQEAETPRLHFVTAASQLGPVGYRDPLGVISPDGERLAYTSGGRLMVTHTSGGLAVSIGRFVMILSLAWQSDSRRVAAMVVDTTGSRAWMLV